MPGVPHQLSWTRWAQSLSVLPRVVSWSCVSPRSNALEILEAQLRAELDRRVNENDLRHKETWAVCPQYLEALGTKLSVEMVRRQSDQDAKLEKQYHTLFDAQDTSCLSTHSLVRPVRRVDQHKSACFVADGFFFSLGVLWYPQSSLSHVSLKGFFELWTVDKQAHSTQKNVTLANVLKNTSGNCGTPSKQPMSTQLCFLAGSSCVHRR